MTRYAKVQPNEWVQPVRRSYLMACCDCGLVHAMDFRIAGGRVQFRARRAVARTVAHRKQIVARARRRR